MAGTGHILTTGRSSSRPCSGRLRIRVSQFLPYGGVSTRMVGGCGSKASRRICCTIPPCAASSRTIATSPFASWAKNRRCDRRRWRRSARWPAASHTTSTTFCWRSMATLSSRQTNCRDDHPAQRSLKEIANAGQRATELVRRILAFSRQQEPARKIIQLQPVMQEAINLLRATIPAKIGLHGRFAADAPLVAADATQIHQIILNLVTNAAYAIGRSTGDDRSRGRSHRAHARTGICHARTPGRAIRPTSASAMTDAA